MPLSEPPAIFKAREVVPSMPVPDLALVATDALPEGADYGDPRAMYRDQARTIVAALRASLPGGTIDAVLVELLDLKRSLLVVPA